MLVDRDAERRLLIQAGDPGQWPPEDARWVALRFMRGYDSRAKGQEEADCFASARALLLAAFRWLDFTSASGAFNDVADLRLSGRDWVWPLLHELAAARADAPDRLELDLAWRLSNEERSERAAGAFRAAGDYERLLSAAHRDSPDLRDELACVRANARLVQARAGEYSYAEVEQSFASLANSPVDRVALEASLGCAQALMETEQYDRATAVLRRARSRWEDESNLGGAALSVYLRQGNLPQVANLAVEAAGKAVSGPAAEREGWLFVAGLASALTRSPGWQDIMRNYRYFYRDYFLLIGRAFAGRKDRWAEQNIKDRLAGIDRDALRSRMAGGADDAWRMLLLSNLNDDQGAERLLRELETDALWEESELRNLPMPRAGLRCEAWFYEAMRQKIKGRVPEMWKSLRNCVKTGHRSYYEYAMAQFLLKHAELAGR
jgi:hypothetical protein